MHLPIAINAEVIMLTAFTMSSMLDTIVKYQMARRSSWGYLKKRAGDARDSVIDEAEYVSITDNIKEMTKVKGIGVAPAELGDLLLGHESAEYYAVLGLLDERAGERPKAYVVLKVGPESGEGVGRSNMEYVQARTVRHKWVREVEFIEEIPKSASGKILRRVSRVWEKRGAGGVVIKSDRSPTLKL